jgi:UDP-glucose 4-epimerase
MKRILITGANSYIGTSFENYMNQWPDEYQVDTVDMIDGLWRNMSFTEYDSVFHVAGIAHIKETKENAHLYYEINRDLAFETAKKVKLDGCKQFIYLSSMSVYGKETGVISKETVPNPKSNYGKSKIQGEDKIKAIESPDFKVVILRPPMVYGEGCKGNFQSIIKVVRRFPIFPRVHNKRSMIYIDNLCAFVKLVADSGINGLFFPQNKDYTDTSHMAELIAGRLSKKIYFSMTAGLCVKLMRLIIPVVKKAFGSLIYDCADQFDYSYCVADLDGSIIKSVK